MRKVGTFPNLLLKSLHSIVFNYPALCLLLTVRANQFNLRFVYDGLLLLQSLSLLNPCATSSQIDSFSFSLS